MLVIAKGHKRASVNAGWGFDSQSRKLNILNLYFHFLTRAMRVNAELSSYAQQEMLWVKCFNFSFNTRFPDSLCLPSFVRDILSGWKKELKILKTYIYKDTYSYISAISLNHKTLEAPNSELRPRALSISTLHFLVPVSYYFSLKEWNCNSLEVRLKFKIILYLWVRYVPVREVLGSLPYF